MYFVDWHLELENELQMTAKKENFYLFSDRSRTVSGMFDTAVELSVLLFF